MYASYVRTYTRIVAMRAYRRLSININNLFKVAGPNSTQSTLYGYGPATRASLTQASDDVTTYAYEKAASVLIGKRNINASDVYAIDT